MPLVHWLVWVFLVQYWMVSLMPDAVRRMTASGRSPIPTPEQQQRKTTPAEGAKAAKEIYDSYIAAGFNEVQAFELLKAVLTAHKTN